MKPGRLRKVWDDAEREATCGPDGWESADRAFTAILSATYSVGGTAAGVGWIIAFYAAVKDLGAEVIDEPEPEDSPAGTIH